MIVELLDPDAPAWADCLAATRHDVYHLPAYVALEAGRIGGQPVGLHIKDGSTTVLLPLILRSIPGGGSDAISPYGYPGPLLVGAHDPAAVGEALEGAVPWLRDAGLVSLFVRLHPILDEPPLSRPGTLIEHGETVVVDLTHAEEAQWAATRSGHRSQITRALRLGHRVVFDERFERMEDFQRLYAATMDRVGAEATYRFDDAYFSGLGAALGERLHLGVVEIGGTVAAAALFTEACGIVQYHLAAADDAYLREGPNKLLLHHARAWARARGDEILHLGGGVGAADDSLLRFKAGFSPLRRRFHTLRLVVDETEYRRLVRLRAPADDPGDRSGFFPAYRRPAAAAAAPLEEPRSGTTDR